MLKDQLIIGAEDLETSNLVSEHWQLKCVDGTQVGACPNGEQEYRSLLNNINNSRTEPTSARVCPNQLLRVRIVDEETSPLAGQCEVVARCHLPTGVYIPLPGTVHLADDSVAANCYEVALPRNFKGKEYILRADLHCAAAYINDAFGPERSEQNKALNIDAQNVRLCSICDSSGFMHVFFKVITPISAETVVLCDYGNDFWAPITMPS